MSFHDSAQAEFVCVAAISNRQGLLQLVQDLSYIRSPILYQIHHPTYPHPLPSFLPITAFLNLVRGEGWEEPEVTG
ncbi:hypothetical protein [Limnofasciculus baicalensis]|uniref:Uncharacterized protein n=1 Tax=Limnofasciculus baicalensis BBK-W-15 TaxID=2699891 RepID=A0AAE3KUJ7_9CYAN|nr:hypothetical protein [Limnofasciculus baicalensis]MCP2731597.1 hypothetical protein [Limnofasciculus baicalensis BBK-W-15]